MISEHITSHVFTPKIFPEIWQEYLLYTDRGDCVSNKMTVDLFVKKNQNIF